jgi:hypothetical protein
MDYKKLRKEAVKGAYFLTKAILENDMELVELETFKLNNTIADLVAIKKENVSYEQIPIAAITGINKNIKK